MFEMGLIFDKWTIFPSELKKKGAVGRIMWDIAFCNPNACKDKKAYLELLEMTAKDIVERIKGGGDE